ncbi:MAG: DUF2442 domain-containing protein [Lentimicrobium sp.]|nr:DUF2442 domain-containing protein [Lentimicrobium sp.]
MKYMVAELMFKALKAWYKNGYVYLVLSDRKQVSFPVELNEKLRNASPEQLTNIEIICNGTGLHWPDLDEDLSVTGIMEGRFGEKE